MAQTNNRDGGVRLRLAVPNKGRLFEPTIALLERIGLSFESAVRTLTTEVQNFPLEILFVAAHDVPEFVDDGVVDLGITGADLVAEYGAPLETVERLGYGHARLVAAVPARSALAAVKDLRGARIATVYPNLAKQFLRKQGIRAEVVEVEGAVEAAPALGIADAIIDISSSGTSLRTNQLRVVSDVLKSEAVLIARRGFARTSADARSLALRLESVLTARRKRYLMMNAPEKMLPHIKKVTPGLSSPTIMKLAKPGMIAVHTVIDAEDTWRVVEELKKLGASGILVVPIERMIS